MMLTSKMWGFLILFFMTAPQIGCSGNAEGDGDGGDPIDAANNDENESANDDEADEESNNEDDNNDENDEDDEDDDKNSIARDEDDEESDEESDPEESDPEESDPDESDPEESDPDESDDQAESSDQEEEDDGTEEVSDSESVESENGSETEESSGDDEETGNSTDTDGASGTDTDEASDAENGDATFDINVQLSSDVDPSAPGTIGIVTWSVDVASLDSAVIEFGLDEEYGMTAPVDLEEVDYRTLLLGMKPDSEYHFRIVAEAGNTVYTSEDTLIGTGSATNLVSVNSMTVNDAANREPGFIVASYWQGDGNSVAFIFDKDGDIVWWHEFTLEGSGMQGDGGICSARMSADGKHMWMVVSSNNGGKVRSVTMDSLNEVTYNDTVASHDITPVTGATMAYLDYGESDCDSIFEIEPDPATPPREVAEGADFVSGTGCHGNALRYSQAEDVFTFSDVSSGIYIVGRQTGALEWKLTDLVPQADSWGGRNHGHHLTDESLLMFANAGGNNASSIIEYTLDGQVIFEYDSGLTAQNLGDVQRLPGGNTLVSYSNSQSYIHEIDADGNLIVDIDMGAGGPSLGYTNWRETLYGPPSDIGL